MSVAHVDREARTGIEPVDSSVRALIEVLAVHAAYFRTLVALG